MIRLAAAADVDRLVEMGLRFLADSAYRGQTFTPDRAASTRYMERLVDGHYGSVSAVLVAGDVVGMFGVFCFDHPFTGERVASETFWWVDRTARGREGLRLFDAGLAWARAQAATAILMIAPNDARVARFYERRGFSIVETSYVMRL